MRCPHCDAAMPDRARFCIECGTPHTAQSPATPSMPAPSQLRYLLKDLAEKSLTSKAVLEGERK